MRSQELAKSTASTTKCLNNALICWKQMLNEERVSSSTSSWNRLKRARLVASMTKKKRNSTTFWSASNASGTTRLRWHSKMDQGPSRLSITNKLPRTLRIRSNKRRKNLTRGVTLLKAVSNHPLQILSQLKAVWVVKEVGKTRMQMAMGRSQMTSLTPNLTFFSSSTPSRKNQKSSSFSELLQARAQALLRIWNKTMKSLKDLARSPWSGERSLGKSTKTFTISANKARMSVHIVLCSTWSIKVQQLKASSDSNDTWVIDVDSKYNERSIEKLKDSALEKLTWVRPVWSKMWWNTNASYAMKKTISSHRRGLTPSNHQRHVTSKGETCPVYQSANIIAGIASAKEVLSAHSMTGSCKKSLPTGSSHPVWIATIWVLADTVPTRPSLTATFKSLTRGSRPTLALRSVGVRSWIRQPFLSDWCLLDRALGHLAAVITVEPERSILEQSHSMCKAAHSVVKWVEASMIHQGPKLTNY